MPRNKDLRIVSAGLATGLGDQCSVVIPAYNGSRFIGDALASVFAQTALPAEVIVVDDASTDDTVGLVETLAASAPVPVRLIRLSRNSGGPARPINVGIEAAVGQFIAVCDQDDVLLPDKLEVQSAILADDPQVVFVFSLVGSWPDSAIPLQSAATRAELVRISTPGRGCDVILGKELILRFLTLGNFVFGYPGFLFRRDDWRRKGGVDESLRIASDYELLCYLCDQGTAAWVGRPQYLRREHATNMTRARRTMELECCRVRSRFLRSHGQALAPLVRDQIRNEMLGLAYWVRQEGRHVDSLACYRDWVRAWGLSVELIKHILKLPLHRILYGLRVRSVETGRRDILR
jgi:glycosyltransferase involved in cell wall biosynthesis